MFKISFANKMKEILAIYLNKYYSNVRNKQNSHEVLNSKEKKFLSIIENEYKEKLEKKEDFEGLLNFLKDEKLDFNFLDDKILDKSNEIKNTRELLQKLGTNYLREKLTDNIHVGFTSYELLKIINKENKKIKLIVLSGLPGSGKDYIAAEIMKSMSTQKTKITNDEEIYMFCTDARFFKNEVRFLSDLSNCNSIEEQKEYLIKETKKVLENIKKETFEEMKKSELLKLFVEYIEDMKKGMNKFKETTNIKEELKEDKKINLTYIYRTLSTNEKIDMQEEYSNIPNVYNIRKLYEKNKIYIRKGFSGINHPSEFLSSTILEIFMLIKDIKENDSLEIYQKDLHKVKEYLLNYVIEKVNFINDLYKEKIHDVEEVKKEWDNILSYFDTIQIINNITGKNNIIEEIINNITNKKNITEDVVKIVKKEKTKIEQKVKEIIKRNR